MMTVGELRAALDGARDDVAVFLRIGFLSANDAYMTIPLERVALVEDEDESGVLFDWMRLGSTVDEAEVGDDVLDVFACQMECRSENG